jgi:hypothetical protein
MKITRQPNARRNQYGRNDECQPVDNHPLSVIVFTVALVFDEAQQRSDICLTSVRGPAQPHGDVGCAMPALKGNDEISDIVRLTRTEHQVCLRATSTMAY